MTDQTRAERFEGDGYVQVAGLLRSDETSWYKEICDRLLSGEIEAGGWRSDLGAGAPRQDHGVENITQIMWPSELVDGLRGSPAYERALAVAREIQGDDMAFDFDMMIDKAPGTLTETPWHQDGAYWIDLPDRRAASAWIALDDSTVDNGCLWFVPGSHAQEVRPHRAAGPSGALCCDPPEPGAVAVPLEAGSCTFHAGGDASLQPGQPDRRP